MTIFLNFYLCRHAWTLSFSWSTCICFWRGKTWSWVFFSRKSAIYFINFRFKVLLVRTSALTLWMQNMKVVSVFISAKETWKTLVNTKRSDSEITETFSLTIRTQTVLTGTTKRLFFTNVNSNKKTSISATISTLNRFFAKESATTIASTWTQKRNQFS